VALGQSYEGNAPETLSAQGNSSVGHTFEQLGWQHLLMPDKALEALKVAYKQHVEWLHSHAEKLETGKFEHLDHDSGAAMNKSTELAQDFRHRANNLDALIQAYERLISKHSP
jgi:hypothetical protein